MKRRAFFKSIAATCAAIAVASAVEVFGVTDPVLTLKERFAQEIKDLWEDRDANNYKRMAGFDPAFKTGDSSHIVIGRVSDSGQVTILSTKKLP